MNRLDREEQDLLDSFENQEWQSVGDTSRLQQIKNYAEATLAQEQKVTLRLSSLDLKAIQAKAMEEGIPYQTLISTILHKFVTGRLIESQD